MCRWLSVRTAQNCPSSYLARPTSSWADALKYRPGSLIVLCPPGAGEAPGQLIEVNVVGKERKERWTPAFSY